MSAEHAYGDALAAAPGAAEIGLKTAVEAINGGDFSVAATALRTTARILEEAAEDADG